MERGRREFVRDSAVLLGASCLTGLEPLLAAPAASSWTIGCMNRPWTKWTFGETLAAVKAAGYSTIGLLTRTKTEPFIAAEATPEYLEGLKRQLAGSGLAANMGALRSRYDVPLEETLKSLRKEIDNAAFLGLRYVLTFGVDDPLQLDRYFQAMARAAAYAAEKKVELVMKPHGGSSGASEEIQLAIQRVGHPNFRIWYDAGNIVYYTGKDPAFAFGTAVPFGLNSRQQNAWMYQAGGIDLMNALYRDHGVYGLPAGNTGAQMGGWFRNEIQSVADLEGLRMRIPGLGAATLARLGVETVQLSGADAATKLAAGEIDAAEWVGQFDDLVRSG